MNRIAAGPIGTRRLYNKLHVRIAVSEAARWTAQRFNGGDYPGYPSVLLSNGSSAPDAALFTLQAALEARGETAGVYDGVRWRQLGGLQLRWQCWARRGSCSAPGTS